MAAVRGRLSSLPGLVPPRFTTPCTAATHSCGNGRGVSPTLVEVAMNKKIVRDPPLPNTTTHPFGRCDAGHPPLFTVNPNIEAHDALVHVALYLRCAYDTGIKALDHLRDRGFKAEAQSSQRSAAPTTPPAPWPPRSTDTVAGYPQPACRWRSSRTGHRPWPGCSRHCWRSSPASAG